MKMSPEIKLTISENDKIIQTLTRSTENQQLVATLEEFQIEANAALTKMIEELGVISEASGDGNLDDDDDNVDDEEDDDSADSSQLASDELKEHSIPKKKKHC